MVKLDWAKTVTKAESCWVANLTGRDPKYHFGRKFMQYTPADDPNATTVQYTLEDGAYECVDWKEHKKRRFYLLVDGDKKSNVMREDIEKYLDSHNPAEPKGGTASELLSSPF